MASIELLDTGFVYRNPEPDRKRNATFPTLVHFADGELLCAMDLGETMHSLDRRSYVCRSLDGGKTWSEPRQMFEPVHPGYPVDASTRISQLPHEELLGLVCLHQRHRPGTDHSNPETDGFVETELALIRSRDRGENWSAPQPIAPPIDWNHYEICSSFVALPGGRLLAPTSIWNDWQGQCPFPRYSAISFISDDGGATWPRLVYVMDLSAEHLAGWEQKQTILSDGRVMAMCWCFDYAEKQSRKNRYALSADNGNSFGRPIECPIFGETNTIFGLPHQYVFSVYRRVDRRGLWAQLARIEGDVWRPLADCPLWGSDVEAYRSDLQAGQHSIFKRMRTLRFGFPTIVSISESELLVAFWAEEDDGVSAIRWLRLEWSDAG